MLASLITFDQTITAYISALIPHTPFFDIFFSFLSLQGLTIFIWLFLFGVFVYRERSDKTHRQFILAFLISFLSTSILVNIVIKNIVQRDRPWVAQKLEDITCPEDFSFPSGHASGAFAGAIIFASFDRKRQWFYYGLSTLISLSRIYLVCHYFLDVLIGALIGYYIGRLTLRVLSERKIIQAVQ